MRKRFRNGNKTGTEAISSSHDSAEYLETVAKYESAHLSVVGQAQQLVSRLTPNAKLPERTK